LTILGIILFLRLGYVVGHAGLARALLVIALANAISILTTFSLSAIATNLKVKGGGDYYLISRTLGVEFGGAIGTVLFLAQSVSIAFYCIGFGEAVAGMLPGSARVMPQLIAAAAVSFLFVFAWLGADWATKFQYVVMGLLACALLSFLVGGLAKWDSARLVQNWPRPAGGLGFWVLFAIFFPAVTGFTQGVSMSGDLEDAGKSLPLGTFWSVGLSIFVYFIVAIIFAAGAAGNVLRSDYGVMKRMAYADILISAGVIAATLSSGMASFLGAPRILQSMATDRVFPFLLPFAKGAGPSGNPRRGVLLSLAIAFATIGLGQLNVIAPIVSMFFLISYGLLNYATFYEARAASPSFRPSFRWYDFRLSLLGWLICLGAILAVDITAGALAMAVMFAIYQYVKRTAGPARWADSSRSYHLQRVREHLLATAAEPEHPRDWRPQILAFSNHSQRRKQLLRFASWVEGGSGLTTAVQILEGEGIKMLKLREEAETALRKDIASHGSTAFPLVVVAPNFQVGIHTLVQAFGVGPLKVNTILLNWLGELPRGILAFGEKVYGRNLRVAFRLGCNIIVLDAKKEGWSALEEVSAENRRIDIWWHGDATGRLMLLLAYLMTRSQTWRGSRIRLLKACCGDASEETRQDLAKMLEEVRIDAEPEVVEDTRPNAVAEHSAGAGFVFLPFRLRGNQLVDQSGRALGDLLSQLPVVAAVLAAEDIDLDAEPEEGSAAEVAEALDALTNAKRIAEEKEKAAVEAAEKADEKLRDMRDAMGSGADAEAIAEMAADAKKAREQATEAARRAAKAAAKAEDAAREAEKLEAKPAKTEDKAAESEHSKKPKRHV
jgi:amino acid transporter